MLHRTCARGTGPCLRRIIPVDALRTGVGQRAYRAVSQVGGAAFLALVDEVARVA